MLQFRDCSNEALNRISDRSYQVEEFRFSQEFHKASLMNCLKESIQWISCAVFVTTSRNTAHCRSIWSIGFRSRFSQCVDYMRFNEKSFCFRWQETTKLMLFGNTETSSLVILCDLRYLTGNISSVMTKHMGVQRKLHRFAYLIVQIILCFYS